MKEKCVGAFHCRWCAHARGVVPQNSWEKNFVIRSYSTSFKPLLPHVFVGKADL